MKAVLDFMIRASEEKNLSKEFKLALKNAKSTDDLINWFAKYKVPISKEEAQIIFDNIHNLAKIKGVIEVMSY